MSAHNSLQQRGQALAGSVAATQTIAGSGTITRPLPESPYVFITNAGSITGVIMFQGSYHGETVILCNKGSGTVTFAAASTSYVACGTLSDAIAALRNLTLVWDSVASRWY